MIFVRRVRIDMSPLREFARLAKGDSLAWAPMLRQLAARYAGFVKRQFVEKSGGGGSPPWAPLAEATIARRRVGREARVRKRTGKKGKSVARAVKKVKILRDTGTLQKALSIGAAGNLLKVKKTSVEYGFDNSQHSDDHITVQRLAVIHDQGEGKVPARPILVYPDAATVRGLLAIVKAATQKLMRRASAARGAMR